MNKPEMKIKCFKEEDNVFIIKASREIEPGIRTGKISFEASVVNSGDYIDCKDPFEFKIFSGDQIIATSTYDYETEKFTGEVPICQKFINHIMIWTYKKWEYGLLFKEIPNPLDLPERDLSDGKNTKLGLRFNDPEFPMTVLFGKRFKDKKDNLYFMWCKIKLGPIVSYEFSHKEGDKTFYNRWLDFEKDQNGHLIVEVISFEKISGEVDPEETDKDILIANLKALVKDLEIDLRATEKNLEQCCQNYLKSTNDYDILKKDYDELKAKNEKPSLWDWFSGWLS